MARKTTRIGVRFDPEFKESDRRWKPIVLKAQTMKAQSVCQMVFFVLAAAFQPMDVLCHESKDNQRLSKIGPAPEFTLTNQDGKRVALKELRGKVLAITFIFASCTDTCPLLTAKMAGIQNRLGRDFGSKVHFVSITVDPTRDTPEVLKRYAEAYKANLAGWAFLTGTPAEIRDVAKRYGLYYKKAAHGDVDHTFLTSIADQSGTLRVQYIGVKFDPDEMLRDIRSVMQEQK
jgi:protein SCO1/2